MKYGRVDEQFSDAVCIDLLEPKETRYIDGVPIDEFKDNQKYRKLPKGWTYNTKLYDLTWRANPEDEKLFNELNVKVDNSESIKKQDYLSNQIRFFMVVLKPILQKKDSVLSKSILCGSII